MTEQQMLVGVDSMINYAKQEVPLPPDFDQSAGAYHCPFGFHIIYHVGCWDIINQSSALDTYLSEMMSQLVTLALIGWRAGSHTICMHTYISCLLLGARLH